MGKLRTRNIIITLAKGSFSLFRKSGASKKNYDFSGLYALKQVLNNEKARILHTIKIQNPTSLYDLAKKLNRNFKSVSDDIKILKRMGFVEIVKEKTKKRIRHKPVVVVDAITITIKL